MTLKIRKNPIQTPFLFVLTMVTAMAWVRPAPMALANPSLLRQSIIDYNRAAYHESLSDGSYKGAAGILNIGPEVARSLGLNAVITKDYLDARDLDDEAERLFSQAVSSLTAQEEGAAGEQARQSGESALASREARASARRHFAAYRSKVTSEADERLNEDACSRLIDSLLEESMKKASFNLRDGLGIFYNRCQGLPEDSPLLTPENVRFVNHVFSEFQQKGSEADKSVFDLGKQDPRRGTTPGSLWKTVVNREAAWLAAMMESCLESERATGYPVDPLLFIALMRRESNFDPRAVSYVGAAGLTQIMPRTGKDLGMKQIYLPSYFEEAMSFLKRERDLRLEAISLISKASPAGMAKQAKLARELMQDSLNSGRKRSNLFARYRKELLENNQDDRLDPRKAMVYGYRYFSDLMQMQKGDISLALASYNAGPHRVKQYNGLPPYAETVTFRNTVLKYYREYLERLRQIN
ncbi:MAG: Lytic transglycosylase protein [Thermodesulfobacteriota bacterium]|nr:Lytic transglycosylase protein [Thermodesulfobacteriota bacterium]